MMTAEAYNPSEWLTQEQVAAQLGVPIKIVWEKVRTLGPAGAIRTRQNPFDRRQTLVHKDDTAVIQRAIFG
jgi:hypothetical protein